MFELGTETKVQFKLYISRLRIRGSNALHNLSKICEECFADKFSIEVIDIDQDASAAQENKIFAVPTLERVFPNPRIRIIGDLSETEKVKKIIFGN